MNQDNTTSTLEKIHIAAKQEFLDKGFSLASLRNIVKTAGVTTGAFYGVRKNCLIHWLGSRRSMF